MNMDNVFEEITESLEIPTRPIPEYAFTTLEFIKMYQEKTGRKIGHSWASRTLREGYRDGKLDRERYEGQYYYWHKDVPAEETGD